MQINHFLHPALPINESYYRENISHEFVLEENSNSTTFFIL